MHRGSLFESLIARDAPQPVPEETQPVQVEPAPQPKLILGMTAPQRFAVALMLLLIVFVVGSILLILTNKVVLPF